MRQDQCVAFSRIGADGEEECVLVAEALRGKNDVEGLTSAIRQRVRTELGIPVAEVVLIKRNSMPKTSSGKVRRRETKARLEAGTLEWLEPSDPASKRAAAAGKAIGPSAMRQPA